LGNAAPEQSAMILVIMGVAGSGKSTIGKSLAEALNCCFLEGDAFHSPANVAKMSSGLPLTDADRTPWLVAIRAYCVSAAEHGQCLILACSALKQKYRDFLSREMEVSWVYLKGTYDVFACRIMQRSQHYMKVNMLNSQFADLEEPTDAIIVDASRPADAIVQEILLRLRHESRSS
jgi:gluconokinase